MKRLKIIRKKDNRVPGAGREKVAVYQAEIRACPKEKIVYVDECGIDTYLYREYGYAARGQKVFSWINGREYKRYMIVMDNASFHCKTRLVSAAHETGTTLIFLSPNSPELNPIEHFWAWLKRQLRRILPFYRSLLTINM